MISSRLNGMKKPTAAILAILLIAACIADVYYTHKAEIAAMQEAGVKVLRESVDTGEYREAERKDIEKILDTAEAAIRESEDQAEIDKFIEDASAKVAEFKTDAVFKIEEKGIAKLKKAVDPDLYREAEKTEITKILDSTEAAIRKSEDKDEIDALVEEAVSKCAEFKTDAEYTQEEEAARRAAAGSQKKKKKSTGSKGCVGTGSDLFY